MSYAEHKDNQREEAAEDLELHSLGRTVEWFRWLLPAIHCGGIKIIKVEKHEAVSIHNVKTKSKQMQKSKSVKVKRDQAEILSDENGRS